MRAYSSTGLASEVTYQYRIRAYNLNGNSAYSGLASGKTHWNMVGGKTVSAQSSNASFPAGNAIDKNTSTRWSASGNALPQWWKVDLLSTRVLSEIEVMWEKSGTGNVYKYYVETSPDNVAWTRRVDATANTSTAQTQAKTLSASARYVRIMITGAPANSAASFYEFRVFGK